MAAIAWVIAFAVQAAAGPEGCAKCSPKDLCPTHGEALAADLKAMKQKLAAKVPGERAEALKDLAAFTTTYGAPTKDVADRLAAALEDEAYPVRTQAATLLGNGQHPDVAVKALVGALELVGKDVGKYGWGRGGRGFGGPGGGEDDPEKQKAAAEAEKERREFMDFARATIGGLGGLPDDRSVEALAKLLGGLSRRNGGELITPVAEALLRLEARAGIEALVAKIAATAGGAAGGGRFGPDMTAQDLHTLLMNKALQMKLTGMPAWSDEEPADWEPWFAKNQKHFPAKLGKYDLDKMLAAAH